MEEIILFIVGFIFLFILYQLFIIPRAKKNKRKDPMEILYLKKVYKNLDFKEIPRNQLLQIIALVSSFDFSLIVSIIVNINDFYLEILIGFISTIVIILISYHLVYLFYKKKGMVKHGKCK